ncbi:MAG: hypothetical protein DYG98_22690 [Haliscomenobacteraceae bacterium CHB4]|nr:hypothetical protein [Saprospiraceae bacterium]MCE7925868.1 hypothetical protein [Haliscomenobacteraceae bacterium CHB4]
MTASTSTRRRYPGAKPFEQIQQDIFFGRQAAIEELYRRISLERLIVLYGKSGDGKSSLVNAGIVPKLEAEAARTDTDEADAFLPVKIRFEAYQKEQPEQMSPVEKAVGQIRAAFQTQISNTGQKNSLTQKLLPGDNSLWATVKDIQAGERRILLVFDQFEELFTYKEAQYEAFGQQLAELFNVLVPMRYVHALEQNRGALTEEENNRLHRQHKAHVLLVIRSDRLVLLNQLQTHLPNIQKINYELPPLSKSEARDAILLPAAEEGDFVSPPFTYTPGALRKIIHALTLTDGDRQPKPIASFQLQILCESIEDKVLAQQTTQITEADVQDPAALYENYYRERIARLGDPKDQVAARHLIEDGLILEEENRRLSLYEGQIRKTYGVPDRVLQQLENDHLLRREPNLQGGYSYELSHDTLVKPIAKFKELRLEEERRREKIKDRWKLAAAVIVAVLAMVAALWSFAQYTKANKLSESINKSARMAQNSALFTSIQENDPTLALRIAEYNNEKHESSPIVISNYKISEESYENKKYAYYSCRLVHDTDILSADFSPDGRFLLTSFDDKAIKWNVEGIKIESYSWPKGKQNYAIKTVVFSQKGEVRLNNIKAVYSNNRNQYLTYYTPSAMLYGINGDSIQTFKGHSSIITTAAFSFDDRYLLTGSKDRTAKLWNLQGTAIQTFIGHKSDVLSVAFSPDGKYILTGSMDSTAKLWNSLGREILTFTGHNAEILSVAFSPDGKYVLTGSRDKTAKVWNLKGEAIRTFSSHNSPVKFVAYSPNGYYALTVEANIARLWFIHNEHKGQPGYSAYQYTLLELREAGVQLEPEDLKKIGKEKNNE